MRAARLAANEAFYPAAALYAALALPASVLGFRDPLWHAHEMLFGFALAVVAGNQLGVARGPRVTLLLLLWLGARFAFLVAPASLVAGLLSAGFAGGLVLQAAPRLFGAAKKLRNLALPAVLTALGLAEIAWEVALRVGSAATLRQVMLATVMLFALLMLFMGGRILAPAVAGQLYRQGETLDARVQPRLEGALLLACGLALAGLAAGFELFSGVALASAGTLAAARLVRWRLWSVRGRPDLWCLAAGYGWLALGLAGFGATLFAGRLQTVALHLITVGALGTLTFNVMAFSCILKARRDPARFPTLVWGTILIACATLARLLGAFEPQPWLAAGALLWAAAFSLLAVLLARLRRRP